MKLYHLTLASFSIVEQFEQALAKTYFDLNLNNILVLTLLFDMP